MRSEDDKVLVAEANLMTGEVSLQPVDCIDPTGCFFLGFHKRTSARPLEIEEPQRQGAGGKEQSCRLAEVSLQPVDGVSTQPAGAVPEEPPPSLRPPSLLYPPY